MTATTEKTGTDVLRAAVAVRIKRIHYAGLARDLSISADTLFAFGEDRGTSASSTAPPSAKKSWVEFAVVAGVYRGQAPRRALRGDCRTRQTVSAS
jgi:hypothetical protein